VPAYAGQARHELADGTARQRFYRRATVTLTDCGRRSDAFNLRLFGSRLTVSPWRASRLRWQEDTRAQSTGWARRRVPCLTRSICPQTSETPFHLAVGPQVPTCVAQSRRCMPNRSTSRGPR
jgi:hypothetical protein